MENEAHPHGAERASRVLRATLGSEDRGSAPEPRPLRGGLEIYRTKDVHSQDRPPQVAQVRRSADELSPRLPSPESRLRLDLSKRQGRVV